VDFVDHVDLEAAPRRRVLRGLEELAHLVDLGVGGRVHFEQVDEAPAVDLDASRALAAGLRRDPVSQLRHFARMRASVVLPTPRVP
jgi:hypothetical protein